MTNGDSNAQNNARSFIFLAEKQWSTIFHRLYPQFVKVTTFLIMLSRRWRYLEEDAHLRDVRIIVRFDSSLVRSIVAALVATCDWRASGFLRIFLCISRHSCWSLVCMVEIAILTYFQRNEAVRRATCVQAHSFLLSPKQSSLLAQQDNRSVCTMTLFRGYSRSILRARHFSWSSRLDYSA